MVTASEQLPLTSAAKDKMKPTMRLRWVMLDDKDETRPVATVVRAGWPESGPSYTNRVLQQWWEENGNGEWRDIDICDPA